MRFINSCLIIVFGMLLAGPATAQTTYTWNAAANTPADWNADDSWASAFGSFVPQAEFDESALISNGGTATVSDTAPDVLNLNVTRGTVRIEQGGALGVTGNLTAVGGNLELSGNAKLTVDGNVRSPVQVTGPNVDYTVAGNYTASGTFLADITGDSHSAITVGGAANLGGTLQVQLSGVTPEFGSSWPLLAADEVTGSFDAIQSPPLPPGLRYRVAQDQGGISLAVSNSLVLTVDRSSGDGIIANPAGGPVTFNSYSIDSASGLLAVDDWGSLMDSGQAGSGWETANPQATHLSELNLTGSTSLDVGSTLSVGSPYAPGPQTPSQEDVVFEYLTLDGELVQGIVEYVGPANDLVLTIDPTSGAGAISNLSPFIAPPNINGYSIDSASGALNPDTWNSLEASGAAGAGWETANPVAQHLSELNLQGSTVLSNGTLIDLGTPFVVGSEQDLVFEYLTASGELLLGTVEYGELPSAVLCNPNSLGDLDGNGTVAFADFLILSANFGNVVSDHTKGDIDCSGNVAFADFLILSANFGKDVGRAQAVPEPSTGRMMCMSVFCLCIWRRRRKL